MKRENTLLLKLTDEEKREIAEAAEKAGMTMSSFARFVLLREARA